MMSSRLALSAVVLVGIAAACGGGKSATPPPATPSVQAEDGGAPSAGGSATEGAAPAESAAPAGSAAEAPATPPGPPGPGDWDKWSHKEKLAYMKSVVMPKMGKAFHGLDAKRFAEPKCVLCHGPGVKDGSFKMPNPDLPKLDLTPAGMKKLRSSPKTKTIFAFMAKTVAPTMADLLGMPPFDIKTKEGFGCLNCHTKKEAAAMPKPSAKKKKKKA